ncbi:hypothetical protein [Legionella impletisoli]|uniref:Substrate of the Dot/Icm secretion system n=1 Tax=Legionella impletisoli TaxID=343510 RepID=A0A917K1Y8_9GAMM|nr:hypothetical protein [Legionella impletisoli]GGI93404.1 hypothetical protein GCM10007966_22470 [Legionella impletisoli]
MPVPSSDSVRKCVEIITNPDAAEELVITLRQQLEKAKLASKFSELIEHAEQFADFVRLKSTQGDPWSGSLAEFTGFQQYQAALAELSIKELKHEDITFDVAISDGAEILRGYSTNGDPLSDEESEELDKLYNAWLAEKGMLTKDGIIYEATQDGRIKEEASGQAKRADAEKIRQLISDSKEGFSAYVKSKSSTTQITTIPRDYNEVIAAMAPEEQQVPT